MSKLLIFSAGGFTMFNDFTEFYENISDLVGYYPGWLTAITAAVHLFFAVFCLKSRNAGTISRIFWICVIIMFPFFGIVAYLLLSVLPSSLVSKKENPLQIRSMLKKGALWGTIGAGAAGAVVGMILNKANHTSDASILGLDCALLGWVISCVVDFFQSRRTDNRFVRMGVYDDTGSFLIEPAGEIFGVKHYREKSVCTENEGALEVQFVRRALLKSLLSMGAGEAVTDSYDGRDYCTSSYTDTALNFAGKPIDAIDVKYIGSGITKYIISVSETIGEGDEAENVMVDRTLYRHRYNISGIIMRCVSLLAVAITLFSPLFGKCHGAVTKLFDDILSNFL